MTSKTEMVYEQTRAGEDIEESSLDAMMRAARHGIQSRLWEGDKLCGGRIEIVRRLGSGAMGTVYEARDGGVRIALKTLNNLSADQLYRLKREFRFLTELVHPNVVAVHELLAEDEMWYFTMECVVGAPLDRYWALHRSRQHADPDRFAESDLSLLDRLLCQIIEGVCAIHDSGLLHRDLKPNNIVVEPDGRVVILDFGLGSDQLVGGLGHTVARQISGTPGFMAPEQAAGLTATTASDWYAVGVILYQLLTRRLPFDGDILEVLRAKQTDEFVPPKQLVPAVPDELDALCCSLLQRDPSVRPTSAFMHDLSQRRAQQEPTRPSVVPQAFQESQFVGRNKELRRLSQLYAAAQSTPVFALVNGESGLGKSELLRTFIEVLQQDHDPFIVRGRCYEQEAIPYKAFDEAIDDLTRILVRLPENHANRLVPRHAQTLIRLFPVLKRVPAFAGAGAVDVAADGGSSQLLRLGSLALRELFARIADERPLVLVIDDLQWSDVDSLRLLAELFAPPDPPRMLVIGSCRSSHEPSTLSELMALPSLQSARIVLPPLSHAEAFALSLSRLPTSVVNAEAAAERIAQEADGHPLYVIELSANIAEAEAMPRGSLERLLQQRIAALPSDAATVLEFIALAARPLPREVLMRASADGSYVSALSVLRAAKLVRRIGAGTRDEVFEPYHERVRLAAIQRLGAEQRARHHETLFVALEADGRAESEWLAHHLQAAGKLQQAHQYALQAARKANAALAFNRAADLFALAMSLSDDSASEALHREHGDALACAGRGLEAAEAYLRAAHKASPPAAARHEGKAAAQLLRFGHVEQAITVLRRVLALNEVHWPVSFAELISRFLFNRAGIRFLRFKFKLRAEHEVEPELIDRLDALYPAQTALGTYDYLRGAYFTSVALPLALRAGEPRRLVTALASEAVYDVVVRGSSGLSRAREIQNLLDEVVDKTGDAYGSAAVELTSALCAYWSGRWSHVRAPALAAEQAFCERVLDGTWETALARSVRHTVEIHSGALPHLAREVPFSLMDATERNDRYAQLDLMRSMVVLHLRDDRVEDARALLAEMHALLERYPVVALNHLVMAVNVSFQLYVGDYEQAQATLDTLWAECKKHGLQRLALLRVTHIGMRADCVLSDLRLTKAECAATLLGLAKAASKEPVQWAKALAKHLTGAALLQLAKHEQAAASLDEAYELYVAAGMSLSAACVRASQSLHAPAHRAQQLAEEARTFFAGQGIVCPERWQTLVHSVY